MEIDRALYTLACEKRSCGPTLQPAAIGADSQRGRLVKLSRPAKNVVYILARLC